MGWGKTLLAGVGGFIVGGPVGAALAAGAVAAGSKVVDALAGNATLEERLLATRQEDTAAPPANF